MARETSVTPLLLPYQVRWAGTRAMATMTPNSMLNLRPRLPGTSAGGRLTVLDSLGGLALAGPREAVWNSGWSLRQTHRTLPSILADPAIAAAPGYVAPHLDDIPPLASVEEALCWPHAPTPDGD